MGKSKLTAHEAQQAALLHATRIKSEGKHNWDLIIKLVRQCPNNTELGQKVRELVASKSNTRHYGK
jgi:hypothetical protein